jgi:peroxiredoxin
MHSIRFPTAILLVAVLIGSGCTKKPAEDQSAATAVAAAKAWANVLEATKPTPMPASWRTNPPGTEALQAFRQRHAERTLLGADTARDFYVRFPKDTNAADAMQREYLLLQNAANLGVSNAFERLNTLEQSVLDGRGLSASDRFQLRFQRLQRDALRLRPAGTDAVLAELEKGAISLQREFPNQPEVYGLMMQVAEGVDSKRGRTLANLILSSTNAGAEIRERAKSLFKKLEQEGQPLQLRFTAIDGREVTADKLRGKVVLVDFWATWCAPCVAELPNVKAAYEKLHEKGFEIVGISLDSSREKLDAFVKKEQMPWPQYFDGKGWENAISSSFNIHSIPAMWLVDKRGIIRDVTARDNLAARIEKLLAE